MSKGRTIKINGEVYDSISKASRILNLNYRQLRGAFDKVSLLPSEIEIGENGELKVIFRKATKLEMRVVEKKKPKKKAKAVKQSKGKKSAFNVVINHNQATAKSSKTDTPTEDSRTHIEDYVERKKLERLDPNKRTYWDDLID